MTSEHRPPAVKDDPHKERDRVLAVVEAAFLTTVDDLQPKVAAVENLCRKQEVLIEKYQPIAEKAQRYKAWIETIEGARE
jgi:hypothetical protein